MLFYMKDFIACPSKIIESSSNINTVISTTQNNKGTKICKGRLTEKQRRSS